VDIAPRGNRENDSQRSAGLSTLDLTSEFPPIASFPIRSTLPIKLAQGTKLHGFTAINLIEALSHGPSQTT